MIDVCQVICRALDSAALMRRDFLLLVRCRVFPNMLMQNWKYDVMLSHGCRSGSKKYTYRSARSSLQTRVNIRSIINKDLLHHHFMNEVHPSVTCHADVVKFRLGEEGLDWVTNVLRTGTDLWARWYKRLVLCRARVCRLQWPAVKSMINVICYSLFLPRWDE